MKCNICPRKCGIDRNLSVGFCGMSNVVRVAKADLFLWEEPVISGTNGSGAIFFSGCNLKCCFCQNYKISSEKFGKDITINRLAEIFKELETKGAHNINLVSGSHYINQIISALKIYKPKIPVVYNSNGYESKEQIELLNGYVDIFLVDIKFFDDKLSQKYCKAKDYFSICNNAVLKMLEQQPKIVMKDGILQNGVIVRHLVMPNCVEDSRKILDWLSTKTNKNFLISLMCQYTPCFKSFEHAEINRKLLPLEYKLVVKHAINLGLTNGFSQEFESATENYIPLWDLTGV